MTRKKLRKLRKAGVTKCNIPREEREKFDLPKKRPVDIRMKILLDEWAD